MYIKKAKEDKKEANKRIKKDNKKKNQKLDENGVEKVKVLSKTFSLRISKHVLWICGQRHKLAMSWVDLHRTSADERDVALS